MNDYEKRALLIESVARVNRSFGDELIFCKVGEMHTGEPVAVVSDYAQPILLLSVGGGGSLHAHNLIDQAELMYKYESVVQPLFAIDFSDSNERRRIVDVLTSKLVTEFSAYDFVITSVEGACDHIKTNGALICLNTEDRPVVTLLSISMLGEIKADPYDPKISKVVCEFLHKAFEEFKP